ncbi:MAG: glycosyltransferase family 4 protein [Patescibacteria group bacterium]|nr:glycosyltransferase family 4 protein [Patescibacteria group bacterium]MDD5715146.1 glycosyltransferase family 4 protein [Patescibacteria group bacterium]
MIQYFKRHVCIVQNVELGSTFALSVFITNLLKCSLTTNTHIDLIVANATDAPQELLNRVNGLYITKTSLYSIIDNVLFSIKVLFFLKKIHKKNRIDIIHCIRPNSSLLGAVLFKVFIFQKIKIIYNVRSPWIDVAVLRKHINPIYASIFRTIAYFSEYILSKFVWRFVFVSNTLRDLYIKKLRLKNKEVFVIPPGVDTQQFHYVRCEEIKKSLAGSPKNIVIGFVGGFAYERDLIFIVQAFKHLLAHHSQYKLVFVGDGPAKNDLESLSHSLGISKSIIFTGRVQHDDVPKYISSLDVGICHLPDNLAYRCSFPLKILEYLACNVPVLASDIIAHREIAKELSNVYLYNFSVDSFIEKLLEISFNTKKSSHEAREAIQAYDWTVLAKQYNTIYD